MLQPTAFSDFFISFGEFRSDATGLYERDQTRKEHRVAGPIEILAETSDERGKKWGLLVRWKDRDHRSHTAAIPRSAFAGKWQDTLRVMLDGGYYVSTNSKDRAGLLRYLSEVQCRRRAIATDRVGWHGLQFVHPEKIYGPSEGNKQLAFQAPDGSTSLYSSSGTLSEWKDNVATFAVGNSRLGFSISCAFAGPLLLPAKQESGGFHLRGSSSTGKTTGLLAAGSVWGGGGKHGFANSWRTTANGLEGTAVAHSDTFLGLDELSQIDGHDAGQAAYLLANGQGKQRANQDGSARQVAEWRLVILSTGEVSLEDKVAEDKRARRANAGQSVRIADITADAGCGLGAFEDLHGRPNAATFADELRNAAKNYYGTAAPAYLERLVEKTDDAAQFARSVIKTFVSECVPEGSDGQVQRVAQRFGLVAAAGELAAAWGIVPWPQGEAQRASSTCFKAWLAARGGSESGEELAAIQQMREFLQTYGDSRFVSLKPGEHEREPSARAGFIRATDTGEREYLLLPAAWREACAGLDSSMVAKTLARFGHLALDASGKSSQSVYISTLGKSTRVYVVRSSILEE